MNPLVRMNLEQIKLLCEKNSVSELYLFGSGLTNEMTENSDVDFAVVFKENLSPIERGDAFFALLESLELLLEKRVDLISYRVIKNPIFKQAIDNTKLSVYAAA